MLVNLVSNLFLEASDNFRDHTGSKLLYHLNYYLAPFPICTVQQKLKLQLTLGATSKSQVPCLSPFFEASLAAGWGTSGWMQVEQNRRPAPSAAPNRSTLRFPSDKKSVKNPAANPGVWFFGVLFT